VRGNSEGAWRRVSSRVLGLALLFALSAAPPAAGDFLWFNSRNVVRDIEKIAEVKLTGEEIAIAGIVMNFFYLKYGYGKDGVADKDAVRKMSDKEYAHAIDQAAKICRNDAAKALYRMGVAGEKLLKALIQTAEDAAKAAGDYIEKKSQEYDKNK